MPEGSQTLDIQSNGQSLQTLDFRFREYASSFLVVTGQPDDLSTVEVIDVDSRVSGLTEVRFLTAINDYDAVDIYLDGELLLPAMGFTSYTDLVSTEARAYEIAVYPAGESPDDVAPIFLTQTVLNAEEKITLVITGTPDDMRLLSLEPDNAPLQPGEARFTFINVLSDVARVTVQSPSNDEIDLFAGQAAQNIIFDAELQNFTWYEREGRDLVGDPLEQADNIDVLEGNNYIYVFTAEGYTETPVLIVDPAELAEPEVVDGEIDEADIEESLPAPQIRVVNAIENFPVSFLVDDILVVSNLAPGTDNTLLTLENGEHVITVQNSTSTELIARDAREFEPGKVYSLIVYGTTEYELFTIEDLWNRFQNSPTIRMINLSAGVRMGLAHSAPEVTTDATPLPDVNELEETEVVLDDYGQPVPQAAPTETVRRSIPFGLTNLLDNVAPLDISLPVAMASQTQQRDVYILDMGAAAIACSMANVTLLAGERYDIIAYEDIETTRVGCFVIPYPSS